MGRETKTVYSCDICGKESLVKLDRCVCCGQDYCDKCEVKFTVMLSKLEPTAYTEGGFIPFTLTDNMKGNAILICKNCVKQLEERYKKLIDDFFELAE